MELKLDDVTFKSGDGKAVRSSVIVIEGKELEDNHILLKEEIPTLIEFLKYQMR